MDVSTVSRVNQINYATNGPFHNYCHHFDDPVSFLARWTFFRGSVGRKSEQKHMLNVYFIMAPVNLLSSVCNRDNCRSS